MLTRLREFIARLFRRKPPEPGRFVADRKFSWRGWLASSPWVWPSREYLVYLPRGYGGWRRRPLIVLIHGCRQTPEDLAAATRIARIADDRGWLVLLPRQHAKANPWACWNWFDPATASGRGEAAIVVAQIRAVRARIACTRAGFLSPGFPPARASLRCWECAIRRLSRACSRIPEPRAVRHPDR